MHACVVLCINFFKMLNLKYNKNCYYYYSFMSKVSKNVKLQIIAISLFNYWPEMEINTSYIKHKNDVLMMESFGRKTRYIIIERIGVFAANDCN